MAGKVRPTVVIDRLRDLFGGGDSLLYECRNCGTTLDDEVEECPSCGKRGIARYTI